MPKYLIFVFISAFLLLLLGFGVWFLFVRLEPIPQGEDTLTIPPPPTEEESVGSGSQDLGFLQEGGFLAKSREKEEIFWAQNGKKYPIEDLGIMNLMSGIKGWDASQARVLTETQLSDFKTGPIFAAADKKSDGLFLKMNGADNFFTIRDGLRHYVPSREFEGRNLDPKDVILISPRLIKKLPFGPGVDHFTLQEAAAKDMVNIASTGIFFEQIASFRAGPFGNHTAINIEKGDILVSKKNKQSLVITQDFEVFIPRQETIFLEGVFGACIDRFKAWPGKREVLDVTLNLKEWNLKDAESLLSLVQLIDLKFLHKEQFAQEAIWRITDSEEIQGEASALISAAGINLGQVFNFPHLSNPSPGEKTGFIIPPELQVPGLVAKLIADCPPGKEADNFICRQELKEAMRLYLEKQALPSTENIFIDAGALAVLIAYNLSGASVKNSPADFSQEALNRESLKLVRELELEGFIAPPLKVQEISILPDRVLTQDRALFKVEGQGILEIEVLIKDLSQGIVFESGPVFGNMFEWGVQDSKGQTAPNGFYNFFVKVKGFKGEIFESESLQLIIRR